MLHFTTIHNSYTVKGLLINIGPVGFRPILHCELDATSPMKNPDTKTDMDSDGDGPESSYDL